MGRLIVWGAGELGERVALGWMSHGGSVIGATRTDTRHPELGAAGIEPHLGSPAPALREDDALLLALPGSPAQREAVSELSRTAPCRRAVFISTTSYYGASGGELDERSAPGRGDRAALAAEAERAFRLWAGARGVVVRLGGLYRRGRGPYEALVRRGSPPLGPENRTLSLIHYDDAATAVLAALEHPAPEDTYLAVTPPSPSRGAFYRAACELLGLPAPEFSDPVPSPVTWNVARLRRDLLPAPAHPDWRQALQS